MKRLVFVIALAWPLTAPAFDLQGHRGARGLMPENTLPAFAAALSIGVATLELDVAVTSDGVVVVSHDPVLQPRMVRRPDGRFLLDPGPAIRALTFAELQRYDVGRINPNDRYSAQFPRQRAVDGTRIPRLTDVFALVRKAGNDWVRFNIELKSQPDRPDETLAPAALAETVIKLIRAEEMTERVTIQSFDWRTLKEVQRIAPEIPTVCLTAERDWLNNLQRRQPGASPWLAGLDLDAFGGSAPRLVQAAGCQVWSPFYRDLVTSDLPEAQELGLPVVIWTVNDEAEMGRLIDLGIDGIITDYPDRLRHVVQAKGLPVPPPTPVAP